MKKIKHLLLLITGSILCQVVAQQFAAIPHPLHDFVLVGETAYGMLPPKAIASDVVKINVSDDFKKILCITSEPSTKTPGGGKLLVADVKSGTARSLLTFSASAEVNAEWLSNQSVVVATTSLALAKGAPAPIITRTLLRIDGVTGRVETLLQTNQEHDQISLDKVYSRNGIYFVATATHQPPDKEYTSSYYLVPSVGPLQELTPEQFRKYREDTHYPGFATAEVATAAEAGTGTYTPTTNSRPSPPPIEPKRDLFLDRVQTKSLNGSYVIRRKEWWLATDMEDWPTRSLAVAEGDAFILPDRSCIISLNDGLLIKRTIVSMPKKDFMDAGSKAESRELLSNAKQVGTAILIYSTDYDDELPLVSGFEDSVYPYIKNREIMQGFQYLRPGKSIAEITDIAKTPMGYIQGRFGRAWVHVDSSSRWESKPP